VINWDLQFTDIQELLTLEIVTQVDVYSICKVRTMEWDTDEGSDVEDGFPFGEGDFALVWTRRGADFAGSSDKTMEDSASNRTGGGTRGR
jgi:hypothetical protein